jgi:ribonuclease HI
MCFHDPCQLYVDGGVIGHNPSALGGTWAARLLHEGEIVWGISGTITPEDARVEKVTNNLTEMLALVKGLQCLPWDWRGTVFSDSQITLGRAFEGWKWKNIPPWLYGEFGNQAARLVHWSQIHYALLDGHPTKKQLEAGIGKRGGPVSIHNQWCDQACTAQAIKFSAALTNPAPSVYSPNTTPHL